MRCIKCRQELAAGSPTCPSCHARTYSDHEIGRLLVERRHLDAEVLERALASHRETSRLLGAVLVDDGLVGETEFTCAMADHLEVPFFDLADTIIDAAVVDLVPEHICERYRLIPVMKMGDRLTVAMMDPTRESAILDIEKLTGLTVRVVVATRSGINEALAKAFDELAHQRDLRQTILSDLGARTRSSEPDPTDSAGDSDRQDPGAEEWDEDPPDRADLRLIRPDD